VGALHHRGGAALSWPCERPADELAVQPT
jgi:hypothetical protein